MYQIATPTNELIFEQPSKEEIEQHTQQTDHLNESELDRITYQEMQKNIEEF